jgi:DNA-binding PadR family transcriptional regulator
MPTPLNLKQFYILLALADRPLHGYAIYQQIINDSRQSLYISFTSLYRLLKVMTARGLIESQANATYTLTHVGRQRLTFAVNDLQTAATLAYQRLKR